LRCYEVKQRLGTTIQFVEFTVTRLTVVLPTTLIEYGKKKGAVVESAILDSIV
jgi:hypothetical protein